jgi:hypothetical protein
MSGDVSNSVSFKGTDRDFSPTHAGTATCSPWPAFALLDYNSLGAHPTDGQLQHTYGLDSLSTANATIVGQFFATEDSSLAVAETLVRMRDELKKELGLQINVVFLNYAMPFACTLKECPVSDCAAYYGGCAPDADVLTPAKWQQVASKRFPSISIFQDTTEKMVWRKFGGGMNDILVYDQSGLLYAYGCSQSTCVSGTPAFNSNTLLPLGYQNIKNLVYLAANTDGALRCQAGSQCSITRQFAPDSLLSNEYVDIIVVAALVGVGACLGVFVPRFWAFMQNYYFSTTTVARDRFIQLSTIDDDGLGDVEGFI